MEESLSRHDQMIKHFVDTDEDHLWMHPHFRKPPHGFKLWGFVAYLLRDDKEEPPFQFKPDAWEVNFCTHVVSLLEVVDFNPIDQPKIGELKRLFWLLDAEGFGLELVLHDITLGVTLTVDPGKMQAWAIAGEDIAPWKARELLTA